MLYFVDLTWYNTPFISKTQQSCTGTNWKAYICPNAAAIDHVADNFPERFSF